MNKITSKRGEVIQIVATVIANRENGEAIRKYLKITGLLWALSSQ